MAKGQLLTEGRVGSVELLVGRSGERKSGSNQRPWVGPGSSRVRETPHLGHGCGALYGRGDLVACKEIGGLVVESLLVFEEA